MNRFIFIVLMMFNYQSFAHSQTPMQIQEVALSPSTHVQIEIGNLRNASQSFEIEINGQITPQRVTLPGGKNRKVNVAVSGYYPDKLAEYEICSISVALEGDMFRSRICTTAKVYFPLTKLKSIHSKIKDK